MANVSLDDATLYYQYLINNNSTSTMLNAISGNTDDSSSLSSLTSSGIGSFSEILQNYLGQNTVTQETSQVENGQMTQKLASVLETASKTEDTSSLTYQTVQELYEYFLKKTQTAAAGAIGNGSSTVSESTASSNDTKSQSVSQAEKWNQAAMAGQEFDFSSVEEQMDAAFQESTLLS